MHPASRLRVSHCCGVSQRSPDPHAAPQLIDNCRRLSPQGRRCLSLRSNVGCNAIEAEGFAPVDKVQRRPCAPAAPTVGRGCEALQNRVD